MNAGMKIGMIGGLIGGLTGIIVAIVFAGIWGVIFSMIFIGLFGWMWMKFFQPIFASAKLLKTGEQASATILSVADTGITVNDSPVVKLKLRIKRPNRPDYETEAKQLISRLQTSYYQPGQQLTVRIDPADQTKVAVESIGAEQPVSTDQNSKLEEMLHHLNEENNNLLATGVSAKATIIRTWDMAIHLNGNNPLMGFWLEVNPGDGPPFQAEAKAAVSEASIYKYQPGNIIWVKYDPTDVSKVTIDHA